MYLSYVFIGCTGFSDAALAFSSCSAQVSHCSSSFCCRALDLRSEDFRSSGMGLVALRHLGSSWTRDRTRLPCTGRQILNHWSTREAPNNIFDVYQ